MRSKICGTLLLVLVLFTSNSNGQGKKWTLEECIEYAMENNISVRQSELNLKVTEIDKKDAFGSFLPAVSANASHSWNIGLTVNPVTNISQNQTNQFTNVGVGAQIDIYKGLQNQIQHRRSKMAIIANQYQLQKMKEDVALNVANAYLQILFNRENLKVQNEQLEADLRQQERSEQLLEGGLIPRGDLLDIEATVAADRQRVIDSENQLIISKLSLAQLLQLDDFRNFDVADEDYNMQESEILLQQPEQIYDKARQEQTVMKIADANVALAEEDVKLARAAYQPTLRGFYSLDTRISYADVITNYDELPSGELVPIYQSQPPFWDQFFDNKGHSFGFQLSIPILNGLSVRNNVERSKVALERSKLELEQQDLDLERNVHTAYTDVLGALRSYEAAVSASEARTLALEYAKERYEVGLINVFDYNQAQTLSVNAQSDVLRTKYDYLFKVKILEFYFGIPIFQN